MILSLEIHFKISFKMVVVKAGLILVLIYIVKAQTADFDNIDTEIAELKYNNTPAALTQEIFLDNDEIHWWNSTNHPKPYPPQDDTLILKASDGYFLSVTVESLDLDGTSGDFLLVKPGTKVNDGQKGKVFTFHLNSPRKILMNSNTAYLSFYAVGKNEAKKTGFVVKYQRIGEEITTTEEPTTVVTWPTPSGSDNIYLNVYVSGKTEEDFNKKEVLDNFKSALAEMATEYCATNNFPLTDNITTNNVQIYYLVSCPYTWPDSDTCVRVRLALPVLLEDNSVWTGYQLNTSHLEPMWDQLASKYLEKYNMYVYSVPDNNSSLTMWVVISCVILIIFLILLYFVKMVGPHFSSLKNIKRRNSDTTGIIQNEARMSKMSLGPHPLQVTPPFFDNDYSYKQFEPDVGIPSKTYEYPLSEDDSDNEIIFTNFSNSRNNIPEQENSEAKS